jgi:SNF2 family DNA or RNA helicase
MLPTSEQIKAMDRQDVQDILASVKFRTEPLDHQKRCLLWALDRKRVAYWLDVGTGKTLLALYTMTLWERKRTLIVCPNPVVQTWADEISKHTTASYVKLVGTAAERMRRLKEDHNFYIINYEGLRVLWGTKRGKHFQMNFDLLQHTPFDSLIIDECHRTKNSKSYTAKCCREVSRRVSHCIVMTGTPLTKDQRDLWSEMSVMDLGRALGNNYWTFVRRYFKPRGYDWVLRKGALEEILKLLAPSTIRFERQECFDLPERVYETRLIEMSDEQKKLTDAIVSGVQLDDNFDGAAILQCGMKMAQVAGGLLINNNNEVRLLKPNPKLDALAGIVEEISGKFIVYHHFVVEGELIENLFRRIGVSYQAVRGGIAHQPERIQEFRTNPNVQALVAHPACGGEGINLYEANTIIFYSNSYNLVHRVQAEGRIYRLGQTKKCLYIDLIADDGTGDSIDMRILHSLQQKADAAQTVLDYIRGRRR